MSGPSATRSGARRLTTFRRLRAASSRATSAPQRAAARRQLRFYPGDAGGGESRAWAAAQSETAVAQTLPAADARALHAEAPRVCRWCSRRATTLRSRRSAPPGSADLLSPLGLSGLHGLLAEVLPQASERFTEVELAKKIDHMGASLSALPGRSSFGPRGEVIRERFDEFFDLFIDVLKRPRLTTEAVDRERQRVLEMIRSRDDRPAHRAYQEGLTAVFARPLVYPSRRGGATHGFAGRPSP